jgi:hypothetical protein
MLVVADFLEDVRVQLIASLATAGFPLPNAKTGNVEDVCFVYYNVLKRSIAPAVRRVHRSRELVGRALDAIPAAVLAEVQRRSEQGTPLTPFLHRPFTKKPSYNDGLLNDWGVHHLHLGGLTPEPDGYMPRSGDVLFALVRPHDLYFIEVLPHGAWADDSVIQIVHDNWPTAIARYRDDHIGRGESPTPEERMTARAAGITPAYTEVRDGTKYRSPGGGITTSGVSSDVVSRSFRLLERAQELQRDVTERADAYAAEIFRLKGMRLNELHFNLDVENGMRILESQSRIAFRITPPGTPNGPRMNRRQRRSHQARTARSR